MVVKLGSGLQMSTTNAHDEDFTMRSGMFSLFNNELTVKLNENNCKKRHLLRSTFMISLKFQEVFFYLYTAQKVPDEFILVCVKTHIKNLQWSKKKQYTVHSTIAKCILSVKKNSPPVRGVPNWWVVGGGKEGIHTLRGFLSVGKLQKFGKQFDIVGKMSIFFCHDLLFFFCFFTVLWGVF